MSSSTKVNAVCERRHGSKVELAEYLQTDKQQVHAMLTRRNEPGGERVLALLEWLEKNAHAEQPDRRDYLRRPFAPRNFLLRRASSGAW